MDPKDEEKEASQEDEKDSSEELQDDIDVIYGGGERSDEDG